MTAALVVCSFFEASLPRPAHAQVTQAPPGEAPAAAQVRAGDAFMATGQYREAAQQYEAGYALDPDVVILERLADAYRRAGDLHRAAIIDQRIAAARGQVAPAPYYAQQPAPYYVQPGYVAPSPLPPMYTYRRPPQKPGQGLINAGTGLLIAGYGIGIIGGAITMGATYTTDASSSWYGAGGLLFVPVIGPFATIAYHSEAYWAVPWAVIDGGMQVAGLALIIAGACVRASARSHPHHTSTAASAKPLPFTLAPYTTRDGAGLLFRARF